MSAVKQLEGWDNENQYDPRCGQYRNVRGRLLSAQRRITPAAQFKAGRSCLKFRQGRLALQGVSAIPTAAGRQCSGRMQHGVHASVQAWKWQMVGRLAEQIECVLMHVCTRCPHALTLQAPLPTSRTAEPASHAPWPQLVHNHQ